MLPAPLPAHAEPERRTHLSVVTSLDLHEPGAEIPFETGLVRSIVIGSAAGFALVFVLVCGGLLWAGYEPMSAIGAAAFVGSFGGIGFGAMEGAALHKPRPASESRRSRGGRPSNPPR